MAQVVQRENHLSKLYEKYRKKAVRRFILGGICMGIQFLSMPLFILTFGLSNLITMPIFLFGIVCMMFGVINYNKARVYESGLEGEARSEGVLSGLPDSYYVFPSIDIEYQGKKSQIDHLVVGPTGVFVIESKNVKGCIVGSDSDKDITVYKTGCKGGQYTARIYNPAKQVATHVYRVSGYLKEMGINTWVQGIVYFTNPESDVCLESDRIPVFSQSEGGGKELYNYILNYENNSLDEDEVKSVVRAIEKALKKNDSYNRGNQDRKQDMVHLGLSDQRFMRRQMLNQQIWEQQMQQMIDQQLIDQQLMNQQLMNQQLINQHIQHAMNESIKASTPFDSGGYLMGPGVNPSDTAAHNSMMNNMF